MMETLIGNAAFEPGLAPEGDTIVVLRLPDRGYITVLDRLTGYGDGDIRDIETGYRDSDGNFWLASCRFDIRRYPHLTLAEAVEYIKLNANTCCGDNAKPSREAA